jgi:hypothetical protein
MQSHIGNTQKTRNRSLLEKVNAQSRQAVATYRASNEKFGKWKGTLRELLGPGNQEPRVSQSEFVELVVEEMGRTSVTFKRNAKE